VTVIGDGIVVLVGVVVGVDTFTAGDEVAATLEVGVGGTVSVDGTSCAAPRAAVVVVDVVADVVWADAVVPTKTVETAHATEPHSATRERDFGGAGRREFISMVFVDLSTLGL
jgi:hypothetical protein